MHLLKKMVCQLMTLYTLVPNYKEILWTFYQDLEAAALVCDVAQMYLHVGVAPKDQPYHVFLWRDLNQNHVPDLYELNKLVFVLNSYPFQAQFVYSDAYQENKELYSKAAETALKSTYMENSMDST